MDRLANDLLALVDSQQKRGATRTRIFSALWQASGLDSLPDFNLVARAAVPFLTEPWYC
jgi:hypothetical protein